MARYQSLNFRSAAFAQNTGEVVVMLVRITHPSLSEPVCLSSDNTVRLSADPLAYGTRHGGAVYRFVLMGAVLPDDQDKSPPRTTLVFENVDADMAKVLRSISLPASVDLTVVLSSTPELIEAQFTKLRGTRASYDANKVSLDISREPFTSEPMPEGRMTRQSFPGLFA